MHEHLRATEKIAQKEMRWNVSVSRKGMPKDSYVSIQGDQIKLTGCSTPLLKAAGTFGKRSCSCPHLGIGGRTYRSRCGLEIKPALKFPWRSRVSATINQQQLNPWTY